MTGEGQLRVPEYYSDGAWYDAEYVHIGGDIPYYQQVALEVSGPVLELACGTGRLTFPMGEAGATVHGIDISGGMIARANAKREKSSPEAQARLSFSIDDMRSARLGRSFSAVVLGFNTLMHMTSDDDLRAALQTVKAHLEPGGLFYFDLHTPFPEASNRDPDGRYDPQQMIDPHSGRRVIVTENNAYNPRTQINTMRFFYQEVDDAESPVGAETLVELEMRVIFPRELDAWLGLVGFELKEEWDDFDRTRPFSGTGGRRVAVARLL